MDNNSNSSNPGFFMGALQRISPASGGTITTTPTTTPAETDFQAHEFPTTTSSAPSSTPLQHLPKEGSSTLPVSKKSSDLQAGCGMEKMTYRQCLELNPDDKINCTWALDAFLKCKENPSS